MKEDLTRMSSIHNQSDNSETASFARMMRLGQVARAQGEHRMAHQYWRQAAIIQPDNETVWMALLDVLESEEDRKVCLRNILAINPANKQAARQLEKLESIRPEPYFPAAIPAQQNTPRTPLLRAIMRTLKAILIGTLIGIVIIAIRFLPL
jgi:hypothetical protein